MITKVFSTRLKPEIIDQIKLLSKTRNQSVQEVVQSVLESGLEQEIPKPDPWAEFAGIEEDNDELEKLLKEKRTKNMKLRQKRKANTDYV